MTVAQYGLYTIENADQEPACDLLRHLCVCSIHLPFGTLVSHEIAHEELLLKCRPLPDEL